MKFSILIPAYKARFLAEAISSVLAQTWNDFELVIVDDCSPEDLKSIVGSFADSRIKFSRNETNCGAVNVVDNWNRCLEKSRGDYVICMGDDDRILPDCLETLSGLIDKYPGLGVYHLQTQIIDESGSVIENLPARPEIEIAEEVALGRFLQRRKQFIGDWCFEARRLKAEGGFYDLPLAWCADDVTVLRACRASGVANTQSCVFQYRDNRLSLTRCSNNAKIKLNAYKFYAKWCRENFKGVFVRLVFERYLFHLRLHEWRKLI